MNWQQKAAALDALSEISVRIRKPFDWYVSQSTGISRNGVLLGTYGNGPTPEAAIEDHWRVLVEDNDDPIVTHAMNPDRRKARRWNGFMWVDATP